MHDLFDKAKDVLSAVRGGATIDAAARSAGVSVHTVRTWLAKGRKDPAGRYGAFARELDEARAAHTAAAPTEPGALSREEWERSLAKAVRRGSVQAMKLWAETHRQGEPVDGEQGVLDELAAKRRGRA